MVSFGCLERTKTITTVGTGFFPERKSPLKAKHYDENPEYP